MSSPSPAAAPAAPPSPPASATTESPIKKDREWSGAESAVRYGTALIVWTLVTAGAMSAMRVPWNWIVGVEAGLLVLILLVIATSKDLEIGRKIISWGSLVGVILLTISMGWITYLSQREAKIADIVAQDPVIAGQYAEQITRENQLFVLGANDAELVIGEAVREAELKKAEQFADNIHNGNGAGVEVLKENKTASALRLIGWTSELVIEGKPAGAQKSFAEDLLSVPWWQAGIFLFFTFVVMTVATWLIVTSFINTIFGKGMKEVKEGLEGWKWLRAWIWYLFDRFIVRWSGKFAAVALVVYVIVASRSWYFPESPLPGSVMWESAQQQLAAQVAQESKSLALPTPKTAAVVAPKAAKKSLHDFKCSLPGASKQYADCAKK